jgi:hypothetical protein
MKAHYFGGDDVEEPPRPRLIREIDDTIRKQHRPVEGVSMPGFCSDERNEVFPETGRQVFFEVHELLRIGLARKAHPAGMSARLAGCGARKN